MRLLHDTPKKRGKSSPSPNLYHALVGASTNSTVVPLGFRVRPDIDPLGDLTGRRTLNRACSSTSTTENVTTLQIEFRDGKGFDHDHRRPLLTDTPTQGFSKSEEPSRTSMYRSPRVLHLCASELITEGTLVDSNVDAKLSDLRRKPTNLPFEKRSTDHTHGGNEPSESSPDGKPVVHLEPPPSKPCIASQVDWVSVAGSGAKILLQIAKDSTDVFAPLKSLLSAIYAVCDQYEVCLRTPVLSFA